MEMSANFKTKKLKIFKVTHRKKNKGSKIFQSEGRQRENNFKGRLIGNGLKYNMKVGANNYLE